jgi:integrase/recombinase XerD
LLAHTGLTVREEWRLDREQTKGSTGRVVFAKSKLRKEVAAYLTADPAPSPAYPVLVCQKGRRGARRGFSANTLCQLITEISRAAGIAGATSHSGRRGFITALADHSVGIKCIMELAGHSQLSATQKYIKVTPDAKRQAVDLVG